MRINFNTFGEYLKYQRNCNLLTLEQASQIIGISTVSLCILENDKKKPRTSTIKKISNAYKIPIFEINAIQKNLKTKIN